MPDHIHDLPVCGFDQHNPHAPSCDGMPRMVACGEIVDPQNPNNGKALCRHEEEQTGTLRGTVACEKCGGIGGAVVELRTCCVCIYRTTTAPDGSFIFENVVEDTYNVTTICKDEIHQADDAITEVKIGETTTVNVPVDCIR